jgi:hypothetical protein
VPCQAHEKRIDITCIHQMADKISLHEIESRHTFITVHKTSIALHVSAHFICFGNLVTL